MRIQQLLPCPLLVALALAPPAVRAEPALTPDAMDAVPEDSRLTGEDIYERVLRNRLRAFVQETRLVSGDRGGSTQESRFLVKFQNFRDENDEPVDGLASKTLIKYVMPFDLRHTAYLVIHNEGRPNDQFVYLPTRRRIRRVNLRGEAVFGSDFSFEDVVPRELYDSVYRRLPDELVEGVPCYVVEAVPKPDTQSEYSRFVFSAEKARYVPLRVRYWNESGVLFKELLAEHDSIQRFDHAWIPTRSTMRNVLQDSFSTLNIETLEANPELPEGAFSVRQLEGR